MRFRDLDEYDGKRFVAACILIFVLVAPLWVLIAIIGYQLYQWAR